MPAQSTMALSTRFMRRLKLDNPCPTSGTLLGVYSANHRRRLIAFSKICMHAACMRLQSQNRGFVTRVNISSRLNVLSARFASSTQNATPTALQAALGSVCARQHTRLFLFRRTIHQILTCTPLYWSPKTCTKPTRSPSVLLVITTL